MFLIGPNESVHHVQGDDRYYGDDSKGSHMTDKTEVEIACDLIKLLDGLPIDLATNALNHAILLVVGGFGQSMENRQRIRYQKRKPHIDPPTSVMNKKNSMAWGTLRPNRNIASDAVTMPTAMPH
jgi:hypothetical protein